MDKRFSVCAYWLARKESPAECAARALRFFQSIRLLDPCLSEWYELATRKRPALNFEVNEENLERLFAAGVNRRDSDHTIIHDLGFQISLANSSELRPLELTLGCGCYSKSVPNSCVLSRTLGDGLPESLLKVPTLVRLIQLMIECFDAHHAVVLCYELIERIEFPLGLPNVGWLTYFSNEFRKLPDFNPPTRVVPVDGKGYMVILTDERFDSGRPDHLAIAKDVVTALRKAKIIPKP